MNIATVAMIFNNSPVTSAKIEAPATFTPPVMTRARKANNKAGTKAANPPSTADMAGESRLNALPFADQAIPDNKVTTTCISKIRPIVIRLGFRAFAPKRASNSDLDKGFLNSSKSSKSLSQLVFFITDVFAC